MRNQHNSPHEMSRHPYAMFAVNMIISLIIMYFVMFSMIDGWGDFRNNLNMLYMALTMVAPMGIIMLVTMGGMYGNRKLNAAIHVGLVVLFVAAFAGTRTQALVGDRQFIASMVPHHSGAILMCREAALNDPELFGLAFMPYPRGSGFEHGLAFLVPTFIAQSAVLESDCNSYRGPIRIGG